MGLFTRVSKSDSLRRDSLCAVPFIKNGIEITSDQAGLSIVSIDEKRGAGFLDRFRPAVTRRRYELDEFGTFVLSRIDNSRSVLEIAEDFRGKFSMSRRECELGVTAFIKLLHQRGIVDITTGLQEIL